MSAPLAFATISTSLWFLAACHIPKTVTMSTDFSQNFYRPSQPKPLRILHVLGEFGHGGVESWLMNIFRAIDRDAFKFDFLVDSPEVTAFNSELSALGARILSCAPAHRRPLKYRRQFTDILRREGPFDVVHSHVNFMSGFPLRLAAKCGVAKRIAHSHNDTRREQAAESLPRKCVTKLMTRWINRYATDGLAISEMAALSQFGPHWQDDPRWKILHYGFDFSQYANLPNRMQARCRLGLPGDKIIIGQVGRLVEQKNYPFSISVVKELVRLGMNVHFLIVGSGHLEQAIRAQLIESGIADRTTMAGDQHEVAPFYGAMDCMLFPSLHEGLGIVALEAQAAGVPIVASEFVPPEADVIQELVSHVPLAAGVAGWAEGVRHQLAKPILLPSDAAGEMARSEYAIQRSVRNLCATYRGEAMETSRFDQNSENPPAQTHSENYRLTPS